MRPVLVEFSEEELRLISKALSRSVTQFLKMGLGEDKVRDLIETYDYVERLLRDGANNG